MMNDTQILISNYQSIIRVLSEQVRTLEARNMELANECRPTEALPLSDVLTIYKVFTAVMRKPFEQVQSLVGASTAGEMWSLAYYFEQELREAGLLEPEDEDE